jgi:hypothetical protein
MTMAKKVPIGLSFVLPIENLGGDRRNECMAFRMDSRQLR